MGQVKSQTDGNKHVTKYVRNALEEVEEVVNPLGKKTLKEYDAAGNLVKLTDPSETHHDLQLRSRQSAHRSQLLQRQTRDDQIRIQQRRRPHKDDRRDRHDQLHLRSAGPHDRKRKRPQRSHQIRIQPRQPADQDHLPQHQSRRTRLRQRRPAGKGHGLVIKNVTKFTYNPDSELETIVFPSATKDEDTYAYNDADQMSEVKMDKSTEVLASLAYTRDNDGQVTTTPPKACPAKKTVEKTYDANNRLTKGAQHRIQIRRREQPHQNEGSSTNTYNEGDQLEKGTRRDVHLRRTRGAHQNETIDRSERPPTATTRPAT